MERQRPGTRSDVGTRPPWVAVVETRAYLARAAKLLSQEREGQPLEGRAERSREDGGCTREAVIPDIDIARLRASLGLSQREFAQGFGVSLGTLRNWEQGRRQPEGPARVLLTVIRKDPQHVVNAIWPERPSKDKRRSAA